MWLSQTEIYNFHFVYQILFVNKVITLQNELSVMKKAFTVASLAFKKCFRWTHSYVIILMHYREFIRKYNISKFQSNEVCIYWGRLDIGYGNVWLSEVKYFNTQIFRFC